MKDTQNINNKIKHQEIEMRLGEWVKKLIAYAAVIVVIFWAGYVVSTVHNNKEQIKDSVTLQVWEQTDKKIDGVVGSQKIITQDLKLISKTLANRDADLTEQVYKNTAKIEILNHSVKTLANSQVKIETDVNKHINIEKLH